MQPYSTLVVFFLILCLPLPNLELANFSALAHFARVTKEVRVSKEGRGYLDGDAIGERSEGSGSLKEERRVRMRRGRS